MTYIYRITNNINGKTYIGQHTLPNNRNPRNDKYMGSGSDLKCDQRLYGVENFSKEIITCFFGDKNKHFTNLSEMYYIEQERNIKGFENVYNISDGGNAPMAGKTPWNKGKHVMTEEQKKNVSKVHKGKTISEEQKCAISKKLKGKCGKIEAKKYYLKNYSNSDLSSIKIAELMKMNGYQVGKSSICSWRKEARGEK